MFRKLVPALVAPLVLMAGCATEASPGAAEVRTDASTSVTTSATTPEPTVPSAIVALAALKAAPDAAEQAGTVSFEMMVTGSASGQMFDLTATGAIDSAARQMSLEMDLGSMLSELAASTGETLPPGADAPMRIVIDGDSLYMRMPILDALTGTSGWLGASPDQLGQTTEALDLGAGGFDPGKLLASLRGVSDDVTVVGREDVRGVATTKYTATVSLADAVAQAPASQRPGLQAQLDKLGDEAQLPVEVWVDDDGLPRRYSLTIAALGSQGGTTELVMEFFDYGEPVTIEVPSPDEVTPITEALGGFGTALGGSSS